MSALPVVDHAFLSPDVPPKLTGRTEPRTIRLLNTNYYENRIAPTQLWGVILICVRRCPTFPPGLGSIIGAGRLSFRVRDGSGRFPAAITAVTLFSFQPQVFLVVGCGLSEFMDVRGCERVVVLTRFSLDGFVCKFSAG